MSLIHTRNPRSFKICGIDAVEGDYRTKEVCLSYHHEYKKLAAEGKSELEQSGFSGFLAHDDIKVSKVDG